MPAMQKGQSRVGTAVTTANRRRSGEGAGGSSSPARPAPRSAKPTARKSTGGRPPTVLATTRASNTSRGRVSETTSVQTSTTRKKPRFRPGTVALREIRKYQKSTDLLLRKLPFARIVSAKLGGF